jgi:hypothetical protein
MVCIARANRGRFRKYPTLNKLISLTYIAVKFQGFAGRCSHTRFEGGRVRASHNYSAATLYIGAAFYGGQMTNTTMPIRLNKRIGSTTYEVHSYFNPTAKETIEEKILRILKNDLTSGKNRGIMRMSQTELLPERSSA